MKSFSRKYQDARSNVLAFLLIFAIAAACFAPTIIALFRDHINTLAIFATNLLLGWTGIGWVVALIWSLTN